MDFPSNRVLIPGEMQLCQKMTCGTRGQNLGQCICCCLSATHQWLLQICPASLGDHTCVLSKVTHRHVKVGQKLA